MTNPQTNIKMKKSLFTISVILMQINLVFSQNWIQQNSNTVENLNSIYFVSPLTGWAVGDNGTILNTLDGGETWNAQVSNTTNNLNDVYFIDDLNGFAVGNCSTNLKTTDGGNTWEVILTEASTCMNEDYAIYMKDLNIGCIGSTGGCKYTTTGWPYSTTPWSGNTVFDIQKVPNSEKIFSCSGDKIRISDDYGASWSTVANYESNLGFLKHGFYIDPYNYYVCNNNTIFKLEPVYQQYDWIEKFSGPTITSLVFLNQQKGYCSTLTGKIYSTSNGASTWEEENANISSPLNTLQFYNDTTGYCVGDFGVILKYDKTDTITNVFYMDTIIYNITYVDSTVYNYKDTTIYDTINVVILEENVTNITLNNENVSIKNYPNPANDKMTIEASQDISKIDIFDISGALIQSFDVNSYSYEIDIHEFSAGIYFMKIYIGNSHLTQKIEISD